VDGYGGDMCSKLQFAKNIFHSHSPFPSSTSFSCSLCHSVKFIASSYFNVWKWELSWYMTNMNGHRYYIDSSKSPICYPSYCFQLWVGWEVKAAVSDSYIHALIADVLFTNSICLTLKSLQCTYNEYLFLFELYMYIQEL